MAESPALPSASPSSQAHTEAGLPPGSKALSGAPSRWLHAALVLGLLAAIPLLSVSAIVQKSATFDEPLNLAHGLACLRRGDWTAPVDYPPLSRWLAAVAAEQGGAPARLDPDALPWAPGILPRIAQTLLYLHNDADALLLRARLAFAPLHVLLALGVWLWSLRLWGRAGALLSLALCAFSPPLLANGPLATNDVLLTTTLFLGFAGLSLYLARPSLPRAAGTGLLLGLALLAKYSALLALPVSAAVLLGARGLPLRARLAGAAGIAGVALLVVWAFYGFRYAAVAAEDPARGAKLELLAEFRQEKQLRSEAQEALLHLTERLRVLPEPYLLGVRFTWKHMERRLSYFLGERSIDGSPWYFPVAVLLKTPLGCLLVLGAAALRLLRRRARPGRNEALCLGLLPAAYFGFACSSHINLGLRYVLPVYPFLFVLAGAALAGRPAASRLAKAVLGAAVAWNVAASLWVHPHHLAYFNELAGGPRGGIRYLGDSNLDWGQDLRGLRPWMDRHGVRHVKLGYFGTALPEYYGLSFEWLPSVGFLNDRPGTRRVQEGDVLAVSATCLQGFYFEDMDTYRWLDAFEPIDHLGYSIYLYRIDRRHRKDAGSRPAPMPAPTALPGPEPRLR